MKAKLNVTYTGKDKMSLHKQIGEGKLPDGRKCRLIQDNAGIHMQVYDKDKDGWKTYSVSYMDLSKSISDIIPEIEVLEKI